jgi:hypothetical protein
VPPSLDGSIAARPRRDPAERGSPTIDRAARRMERPENRPWC